MRASCGGREISGYGTSQASPRARLVSPPSARAFDPALHSIEHEFELRSRGTVICSRFNGLDVAGRSTLQERQGVAFEPAVVLRRRRAQDRELVVNRAAAFDRLFEANHFQHDAVCIEAVDLKRKKDLSRFAAR